MAGETEARIRAIYAGPFDVERFHPEIEWHLRADLPDSATLRGREEVARNAAGWLEAFDDLMLEPMEVSEAVGKIIVVVHFRGSIKGTGKKVEMDEVHVLTEREGKLIEIREYLTRDEALHSLGLAV